MVTREKKENCCSPAGMPGGGCRVEGLVSVDERGQMVLPKEAREKAGIHAGDKLAVVTWEKDGKTCCLTLIKAEELTGMVKTLLGPLMEEVLRK
ncbi:MAG: AbrB family transcriptional regulator [Chloroflexi bacterium RBG_16_56_11]|nr:MAG: AbrB family transcriptional regulator [Chloroflexi bacterium RBG_16_56_11]